MENSEWCAMGLALAIINVEPTFPWVGMIGYLRFRTVPVGTQYMLALLVLDFSSWIFKPIASCSFSCT